MCCFASFRALHVCGKGTGVIAKRVGVGVLYVVLTVLGPRYVERKYAGFPKV